MKDIHVIEHREFPEPDRGQLFLADKGFNICLTAPYRGEALPDLNDNTAGVIIMGGPQYLTHLEEFPYLSDEMEFAGKVMAKAIPLLGICLGSQIIARHLGARVAFHPEVTRPILDFWHELLIDKFDTPGTQNQGLQNQCFDRHDLILHEWYTGFLDRLFVDN